IEGDVVGQAMGLDLDLWQPEVAFMVLTQAYAVGLTRLLDSLEARCKTIHPALHRCLIGQLLDADTRQVDEVLGEILWIDARQTIKSLHHASVIGNQLLQ